MDYVFLIAGSIVILTCFYFIVSPFFSNSEEHAAGTEQEDEMTLEQVYGAVNELEMDFLMKKITSEDFEKLKEQYQLLAADLMKKETITIKTGKSNKQMDEVEDEIRRELKKLRRQKG